MTLPIAFDNSYARLPDRFFARIAPTPVASPSLVRINAGLADSLGLDADWLASAEGIAVLSGKTVPEGAEPLAMAYAGHQFGNFVPQLGDGRAVLLGEVVDRAGIRRDIQLKGSGPTPFSRRGDGRAALGPVLREYLISEAMAALGIPTTRMLAAVMTGEPVYREAELPGAVLTRVASSHIRVGTFQFFAARGDLEGVRLLAEHVIARHYPQAAEAEHPVRAMLEAVIAAQARLVAHWLLVGFIHGVMNTDNMSIAGETIDYGPCAFMDAYNPATVFSSIDQGGRYAYGNQPRIAQWNLARLAETLLPLLHEDEPAAIKLAEESLNTFVPAFEKAYHDGLRRKIGLSGQPQPGDQDLVRGLLSAMVENQVDFTLAFRRLADAVLGPQHDEPVRGLFVDPTAFDRWAAEWRARLAQEPVAREAISAAMRATNPAYIPRNHRVEEALAAAVQSRDFAPFEALLAVVQHPYDDQPGNERFAEAPDADNRVYQTFCGT